MGKNAFTESDIPPAVKTHLVQELESIPHARLLLIRSPRAKREGGEICYVVRGREVDPFYYTLRLKGYEDLVDLDIPKILSGGQGQQVQIGRRPFYLVCTNGKRDPCCARHGRGVFKELSRLEPEGAWECSHVGGHRFAANVLMFPHGVYYGRTHLTDLHALLRAGREGRVLLNAYRGRTCYHPAAQAAEEYLRRHTGRTEIDAFHLLDMKEFEPGTWSVEFADQNGKQGIRLIVKLGESLDPDFLSCGADKPAHAVTYEVLSSEVVMI